MSPTRKTASNSATEIVTIRIELRYSDPAIWREVEVPTSITLNVLHDVVQAVMRWEDDHLWEFTIDKQTYGPSMDEDWGMERRRDSGKVRLRDVLRPRRTMFEYLYDFGDNWAHRLVATRIRAGDPETVYPRYVGGGGSAPPEDCGGLGAFYDMLDALADPAHVDHCMARGWADDYYSDTIDETRIKDALSRIANLSKPAQTPSSGKAGPKG